MARPASASTPGASKRKRDFAGEAGKSKKSHKGKSKRGAEEARGGPSAPEMRKMDSPAVQRAKREIKIRRLTTDQVSHQRRAAAAVGLQWEGRGAIPSTLQGGSCTGPAPLV